MDTTNTSVTATERYKLNKELAQMLKGGREVEGPVMRLAQKARAIGIHLIIATQRPDVKVITGGIKANFPVGPKWKIS